MYTCRHIFVVLIEVWRLMSRRVSPIAHRDSNIEKLPVIVLGSLEYTPRDHGRMTSYADDSISVRVCVHGMTSRV